MKDMARIYLSVASLDLCVKHHSNSDMVDEATILVVMVSDVQNWEKNVMMGMV
jgi:hypothetical protein